MNAINGTEVRHPTHFDQVVGELSAFFNLIADEELNDGSHEITSDTENGARCTFTWSDPTTGFSRRIEVNFHFHTRFICCKLKVDIRAVRMDCQRDFPRICVGIDDDMKTVGVILYDAFRWTTHKAPTDPELLRLFTAT